MMKFLDKLREALEHRCGYCDTKCKQEGICEKCYKLLWIDSDNFTKVTDILKGKFITKQEFIKIRDKMILEKLKENRKRLMEQADNVKKKYLEA